MIPISNKYVRLDINSNEFLKLYMKKENIHCGDREKASNISKNLGNNLNNFAVFSKRVRDSSFNK